jgi:hypothetical protein
VLNIVCIVLINVLLVMLVTGAFATVHCCVLLAFACGLFASLKWYQFELAAVDGIAPPPSNDDDDVDEEEDEDDSDGGAATTSTKRVTRSSSKKKKAQ